MPLPVLWIPLICLQGIAGCAPTEAALQAGPVDVRLTTEASADSPDPAGDLSATLRSLVLPGWGQWHRDRSHWWVYPAIELGGVLGVTEARRAGARARDRYRDLAWTAARAPLASPDRSRVDGSWEYYERMSRWESSGRFDAEATTADLVPESDPSTFNGSIWQLARQLHLPEGEGSADPESPGYQEALEYYRSRAVPDGFLWDWGLDPSARAPFNQLISRSDERFRRSARFAGVIFLNHFLSATDAWLADPPGPLERLPVTFSARASWLDLDGRWTLEARLLPRKHRSMH